MTPEWIASVREKFHLDRVDRTDRKDYWTGYADAIDDVERAMTPEPLPTWCRAHGALDQCPEHCPIGGGYFHGDVPCSHHPNYGCIQADGKRHGGS